MHARTYLHETGVHWPVAAVCLVSKILCDHKFPTYVYMFNQVAIPFFIEINH